MEFSAKPSRSASRHRRKSHRIDYNLFARFAQALAEAPVTPDTGGADGLDPTQLQEGQSVFDNEGNEQVIVGDPEGTTDKVIMPVEQVDMGVPANANTVDDAELASQYSLQSPLASADGCTYFPGENVYIDADGCNRRLGFDIDSHLPDYFQEFVKQADTIMDLTPGELAGGTPDLATSVEKDKEADGFRIGQPGYMEIIDTIKEAKSLGYEAVDILLMLGEKYDRDFSERVLAEARRKGII
jgi:hypothetical protein